MYSLMCYSAFICKMLHGQFTIFRFERQEEIRRNFTVTFAKTKFYEI